MTIQWLLIIVTASRLYLPVAAYDTQTECAAALAATEAAPSASLDCVLVTVKEPRRRRKKHAFT